MTKRGDKYLAITATQARHLRDALEDARRGQRGAGPLDGRMAEQEDVPAALRRVRLFVRKHGDQPGYYTTLADLASANPAASAGRIGEVVPR